MKRVVIIAGTCAVVAIGVLGFLLVGARSDLADARSNLGKAADRLELANSSHSRDSATISEDRKHISELNARILVLAPPAWTKHEAAAHYLGMVKPGNVRIDVFNKIKTPTLRQATKFCRDMFRLDNTFAQDLQGGHWPISSKAAISELVDSIAGDVDKYDACAKSTSWDQYNAVVFTGSKAAQKVRILLGLPGAS